MFAKRIKTWEGSADAERHKRRMDGGTRLATWRGWFDVAALIALDLEVLVI